jgi:hypothetical protein
MRSLDAEHGTLCGLKLHCDVEPIENVPTNQLTALDCFVELTRVVADRGHAFIDAHTVSVEQLIQPRARQGDFLVHIGVQLWGAIREGRSPDDDVDIPALPSSGIAVPQP